MCIPPQQRVVLVRVLSSKIEAQYRTNKIILHCLVCFILWMKFMIAKDNFFYEWCDFLNGFDMFRFKLLKLRLKQWKIQCQLQNHRRLWMFTLDQLVLLLLLLFQYALTELRMCPRMWSRHHPQHQVLQVHSSRNSFSHFEEEEEDCVFVMTIFFCVCVCINWMFWFSRLISQTGTSTSNLPTESNHSRATIN